MRRKSRLMQPRLGGSTVCCDAFENFGRKLRR
jgi:hypothetical protein